MRSIPENFREFMQSAETHQTQSNPYVNPFVEVGRDLTRQPFHLEKRPEIGENNEDNMAELEHSPKEMVMQNLEKIKKCIECMIDTVHNNDQAEELILNHAWMVDHISTSADDLQESCDFMCHKLGEENTSRSEEVQLVDPSHFEQPFESNMCNTNFTSFLLESEGSKCKCGDNCKCKDCKTHKRGKYAESVNEGYLEEIDRITDEPVTIKDISNKDLIGATVHSIPKMPLSRGEKIAAAAKKSGGIPSNKKFTLFLKSKAGDPLCVLK
jgi:hypothetical protein